MAKGYKTGGRRKGTPNKLTRDLREMILGALADAGGRDYLTEQARQNPGAFLRLVGRLLPMQVSRSDDADDPVEAELSDVEVARRLAFLLARGSHALDSAAQAQRPAPRAQSPSPLEEKDEERGRAGRSPYRCRLQQ